MSAPPSPPHAESLLRIPLVAQMLADPGVTLVPRQLDRRWYYHQQVPLSLGGFNPYRGAIYYGARSAFASFLAAPHESARTWNEADTLLREALFCVHDYLHTWACRAVRTLRPGLGLGERPITTDSLEDLAFCHILTEAVATVGLDYWYLSTIQLEELLPIGTAVDTLTVSYHERHLPEYRRACPSLVVQDPAFFQDLCEFYCTGVLRGFDRDDLRQSPRLLFWLRHELSYGEKQREYTRRWLCYLAPRALCPGEQPSRPIACDQGWQRQLVRDVGALLWRKVKEGRDEVPIDLPRDPWQSPADRDLDFRFLNWNCVTAGRAPAVSRGRDVEENLRYAFYQLVSQLDWDACDRDLAGLLPSLLRSRDLGLAVHALRAQPRVSAAAEEPRDLFFLS